MKRQVELVRQQMQGISLNVRDRFKEKTAGKADNEQPIPVQ